jgi:hypothetical protein
VIDEAWFETTGRYHLHAFFRAITDALRRGETKGLRPTKVNADELLRAYRGESPMLNLTDEQKEMARRNGIPMEYVANRVNRQGWSIEEAISRPVKRRGAG